MDNTDADILRKQCLTVDVNDVVLVKTDAEFIRLDARDILRALICMAGGVLAEQAGERDEPDLLDDKDVKHAVVRARGQRGVEAAAVVAPVADADERKLLIDIDRKQVVVVDNITVLRDNRLSYDFSLLSVTAHRACCDIPPEARQKKKAQCQAFFCLHAHRAYP